MELDPFVTYYSFGSYPFIEKRTGNTIFPGRLRRLCLDSGDQAIGSASGPTGMKYSEQNFKPSPACGWGFELSQENTQFQVAHLLIVVVSFQRLVFNWPRPSCRFASMLSLGIRFSHLGIGIPYGQVLHQLKNYIETIVIWFFVIEPKRPLLV